MVVTGASSSRDERRSTTPSARPRHLVDNALIVALNGLAADRGDASLMRERRAAAALRVNVMATTSVGRGGPGLWCQPVPWSGQ